MYNPELLNSSPEGEAELEAQKNPLEEMPPFEEHIKTFEQFENPTERSLVNEPFGNPIEKPVDDDLSGIVEDKQEKTDLVDKASSLEGQSMAYMPFGQPVEKTPDTDSASRSEISQPAEAPSEAILNREKVYAGEKSSIYKLEKEGGKTSTQVESEFFDIAEGFKKSHDEVQSNFDLGQAMSGLSLDLALIDATRGKTFEQGNEKHRASLLEDYSTLRSLLDDPETDQKDKDLISEYFEKMDGEALRFLEDRYSPEQAKPVEEQQEEPKDEENKPDEDEKPDEEEKPNEEEKPDEEQEKRKEKLEDTLSEIRRNLEAAKADMLEDVSVFDKVTAQMQELLEDRKMNMDLDELNTSLIKLQRAADELATSNSRFRAWNTEYGGTIINGRNILDEGEYRDREKGVYDNVDLVSRNNRKLDETTERIAEIRKYIRAVEEAYDAFRRF